MHLGTQITYWLKIALGSIALHLAFLSTFSAVQANKPVELVYLPNLQVAQPAQKVSPRKALELATLASGTTQPSETLPSPNAFNYLRDSLYRELNAKLKNRSVSSDLLLLLNFSSNGTLAQTTLIKSSGRAEFDSDVLEILRTARIYNSPELANLKIQVPLTLR